MKPLLRNVLLLSLILAGSGGGYLWYSRQTAQSPEQRYRIQAVEKGDIVQTVSANGTLNPVVLVNVGTQVSGTVTKLYVDFNDKVEKGQPLVTIHANDAARLSEGRAMIEKAFRISDGKPAQRPLVYETILPKG